MTRGPPGDVAVPELAAGAASCPARLAGCPARSLITRARRCLGAALPSLLPARIPPGAGVHAPCTLGTPQCPPRQPKGIPAVLLRCAHPRAPPRLPEHPHPSGLAPPRRGLGRSLLPVGACLRSSPRLYGTGARSGTGPGAPRHPGNGAHRLSLTLCPAPSPPSSGSSSTGRGRWPHPAPPAQLPQLWGCVPTLAEQPEPGGPPRVGAGDSVPAPGATHVGRLCKAPSSAARSGCSPPWGAPDALHPREGHVGPRIAPCTRSCSGGEAPAAPLGWAQPGPRPSRAPSFGARVPKGRNRPGSAGRKAKKNPKSREAAGGRCKTSAPRPPRDHR